MPPTITGTAPATVTAGEAYNFTPQAQDADSDDVVSFTIANKPTWAAFDTASGALSGTPEQSHVGTYADIEIAATDGEAITPLPAFTLTVNSGGAQGGTPGVTLSWIAPTENEDGTPLVDLKGYKIHYGTESQNYSTAIPVENPGLTSYVVSDLPKGTYFFSLTAMNTDGSESPFATEVSLTLN